MSVDARRPHVHSLQQKTQAKQFLRKISGESRGSLEDPEDLWEKAPPWKSSYLRERIFLKEGCMGSLREKQTNKNNILKVTEFES